MNEAIIGIGSNISPEENIHKAISQLKMDFKVLAVSEMIRTKPIGIAEQADFMNGAIKITTPFSKEKLNNSLKKLEDKLGRDRTMPKFGSRTIDLDIVIWNNEIIDDDYFSRDFLRKSCIELGFTIRN